MNKTYIIDLKKKDQKKKKIINIKYNILNHKFHIYFVTEIISVKKIMTLRTLCF